MFHAIKSIKNLSKVAKVHWHQTKAYHCTNCQRNLSSRLAVKKKQTNINYYNRRIFKRVVFYTLLQIFHVMLTRGSMYVSL